MKKPVSKFAFQMQPAALQHGNTKSPNEAITQGVPEKTVAIPVWAGQVDRS
jgi:hypothetical protein